MIKLLAAPALALALIAGLVIEKSRWPEPSDVEGYHTRVAEAIRELPEEIDGWTSSEVELPLAAVAMLKPNEILSRRYRDPAGGRSFHFLIIHCRDARDMIGHFPPVCYPAAGWAMRDRHEASWSFDTAEAMTVKGMGYDFEQLAPGATTQLYVTNLLILPDGTFARNMREVNRIAADRQFRVYGAAQVQFVFGGQFSDTERDRIVKRFTAAAMPAVQAIRTGVQR
ncbi:MAG: exosortase-associated EpsI family protein [Phycisphaeraceae bacterium]